MSFGGGAFGAFGQNNNNQPSAFGGGGGGGGFGTNNNNTNAGFGAANTGGGFGANTGTSLFGGNNNNNAGGFGGGGGGFGANNTGGFGNKPAFGATGTTAGNTMFGGTTANTTTGGGFGGFGTNNNNTNTAFGANNNATTGGLFGAKPAASAFGTPATGTTGTVFGGGNAAGGFGASTGFGGANNNADPPGTAITPFQAHSEKEANSTTSNAFQNILFQEPYKKWSAEELRLVDYAQGRRHGNATGGGAFGVASGFGGGFGANNNQQQQTTTAFGANNNTAGNSPFGNSNVNNTGNTFGNAATSAFGNNTNTTAGGIFGANKPAAGGGLFGGGGAQPQQGASMFGGGNTGFGANNNANNNTNVFGTPTNATGGGMFAAANQNKPAGTGFGFGQPANNAVSAFGGGNTTGGFGAANNNQNTTAGGLFGGGNNNNNAQPATGGVFGGANNTQQNNNTSVFGAFGQQNQAQQAGGGLFGAQNKPATGTGLFGSNSPAMNNNNGGSVFGNANNAQQTGSVFGQNNNAAGVFGAAKPATGGGLFGNNNNAQPNTTGVGLFGAQNNTQQAATGGLFGAANNNQQKPGGLFGGSAQPAGSVFGGQNQNQGASLFGGGNQQQNQQGSLGGSFLGNSQQSSTGPQGLTANLNDVSAYGTPALFSGLGGNETPNPGPLATPVSGSSKPRRSSVLSMYKLAPASASRFATPQKRGFGFSYSSYGTPGGSPVSISGTPSGLGRSLLGSSTSGSLSRSMSTSNLRRTFNAEDSILTPGAFSASSGHRRFYGSMGSKKLVINREIRSDLFSTPQKEKPPAEEQGTGRKLLKRVSFDTGNADLDETATATPVRALPAPAPEDTPSTQNEDTPRQTRSATKNGANVPERSRLSASKELAIVEEENNTATSADASEAGFDTAPGQYWMRPSKDELQSMNRIQRQKIDGFTVGREHVGNILFKVPVDLSGIDLDEIFGGIVQLEPRSATVYPIAAKKPPMGKGLNVPAKISLEQSWPRGSGRDKRISNDPRRFTKHIERLKRIPDTTFEGYDKESGIWSFSVEHFTTYSFDQDESDDSDIETELTGEPENVAKAAHQTTAVDTAPRLLNEETPTFFRQKGFPGAFENQEAVYDEEMPLDQSFLGASSADLVPNEVRLSLEMDDLPDVGFEYDVSDDEDMAKALVGSHHAAELAEVSSEEDEEVTKRGTPGGILRARMRAIKDSAGPVRLEVPDGDDWAEMLRKTVSPMKRDRQELRELNESPSKRVGKDLDDGLKTSVWGRRSLERQDKDDGIVANPALDKSRGFATSIDLMNSLFEKPKPVRDDLRASQSAKEQPEWPVDRPDELLDIDETETAFDRAPRVTWGPNDTLVITRLLEDAPMVQSINDKHGLLTFQRSGIQTDAQYLRFAKFSAQSPSSKGLLQAQEKMTDISVVAGVPFAVLRQFSLNDISNDQDMTDPASTHEKQVWELAKILFGSNLAPSNVQEHVARKKKLSEFWTELVGHATSTAIDLAGSEEEKAVACLSGNRISEACKHLLANGNFRIGTLVSLIGTSDSARKEMKEQLKSWQDSKMLSEFPVAIRTICEMLSGNVCACEGLKDVPIEDRMDSFVISKKFGLDWRQAFGLRLWYALSKDEDVKIAVQKFQEDIDQDKEAIPLPWFVEQGIKPLWDDADLFKRQDLLWGLLQLYAEPSADLEAVLRPENSQVSPLDVRLCWQLGQVLLSTGKVSYGTDGDGKADATTIGFAAQLSSAGEWLEAVFVLLHLRDATARRQALQEHICRHAGLIGTENGPTFTILTEKLLIPPSWVWEALALHMRSVKKDATAEVHCLLKAGSFEEAHRVLVNQVAPQAIIERNYAGLSGLIAQFEGYQDSIPQWPHGGEIYGYFLELMQHRRRMESVPGALLERLLAGLKTMSESGSEMEIVRYAAVSDMADETAREFVRMAEKKQDVELRSKVLRLPLTQDRMLAYSVDLGLERFREVLSH